MRPATFCNGGNSFSVGRPATFHHVPQFFQISQRRCWIYLSPVHPLGWPRCADRGAVGRMAGSGAGAGAALATPAGPRRLSNRYVCDSWLRRCGGHCRLIGANMSSSARLVAGCATASGAGAAGVDGCAPCSCVCGVLNRSCGGCTVCSSCSHLDSGHLWMPRHMAACRE